MDWYYTNQASKYNTFLHKSKPLTPVNIGFPQGKVNVNKPSHSRTPYFSFFRVANSYYIRANFATAKKQVGVGTYLRGSDVLDFLAWRKK